MVQGLGQKEELNAPSAGPFVEELERSDKQIRITKK